MTRIFEVKSLCPCKVNGEAPIQSTYRVSARDAEKAIAKAKKSKRWESSLERAISVVLLAETDEPR